ncbi:glycosyltransferase family 2 protein [Tropheryma whipplei]|uniref:glycosyltransferase family 2 protein n=1 Tax=Tropheryma whipplei TaxID=2039 RepID=UPI0005AAEDDD|nr:glycosyltransferase family 2 protein [Tropheryma whipplei]
MTNRVLVVVPAHNEALSLPGTLQEIKENLPGFSVLVIDDGSTDATSDAAEAHSIKVIRIPFNAGVGGAMRLGFRFALRKGFNVVVQVDADGQHNPKYVSELINRLNNRHDKPDIVIGARFAGCGNYKLRGPRRWAIFALSKLMSRFAKTNLTDVTSGFRASGTRAIKLFAEKYPTEYLGDTVESVAIALKEGLVVRQVPVAMRERKAGTPSHGPCRATLLLLRVVVAALVAPLKSGKSKRCR